MWRKSLFDVKNKCRADVGSDHHLVIDLICLIIAPIQHCFWEDKRIKYNIQHLSNPTIAEKFRTSVETKIANLNVNNNNPTQAWNNITDILNKASEEIPGVTKRESKAWLSSDTWQLINERKNVKTKINQCQIDTEVDKLIIKYNKLNKTVKHSARCDNRKRMDELAMNAQVAAELHQSSVLYRLTTCLANKSFTQEKPIKDKYGELITSSAKQLEIWTEHFKSILKSNNVAEAATDVEICDATTNSSPLRINIEAPSETEIRTAFNSLKAKKAAGPVDFAPDVLKAETNLITKSLVPILVTVWNTETIPVNWKEDIKVKLPKKCDRNFCNNWPGITLLNMIYKILA